MDYVTELTKIRDKMHRQLICTIITDNRLEQMDYVIHFRYPIECTVHYYRPVGNNGMENVIIRGIDGENNELISVNEYGDKRYVYYSDLKLEDLATVHRSVMTKNYIIKQVEVC